MGCRQSSETRRASSPLVEPSTAPPAPAQTDPLKTEQLQAPARSFVGTVTYAASPTHPDKAASSAGEKGVTDYAATAQVGAAAQPASTEQYEFICSPQVIGRGTSATVFLGAMRERGNSKAKAVPVAVKAVDVADAIQLAALEAEYGALRALAESPHVVKVHHFEAAGGKAKIFMELCRRGSLRSLVKRTPQGRLHESAIRMYLRDGLAGLAFLHQQRLLHRDVKPDNFLLVKVFEPRAQEATVETVHVKISDLGTLKWALHGTCATTANVVGTVPYMSYEAIHGKFSEASDVWAWAVTFIELATPGQMVWAHLSCRDSYSLLLKLGMLQPPNHCPPLPSHLSSAAKALLARCLAFEWRERPSAAELLRSDYFARIGPRADAFSIDMEPLEAFEAAASVSA